MGRGWGTALWHIHPGTCCRWGGMAGAAFFPAVGRVPLERNPDQTRQVNRQPSARRWIHSNDFMASLGITPQPPRAGSHAPLGEEGLQFYGRSSYEGGAGDLDGRPPHLFRGSGRLRVGRGRSEHGQLRRLVSVPHLPDSVLDLLTL